VGAGADPDPQLALTLVLTSGIETPFDDLRTARIGGSPQSARHGRTSSANQATHDRNPQPWSFVGLHLPLIADERVLADRTV
jgi:hypothetical protein